LPVDSARGIDRGETVPDCGGNSAEAVRTERNREATRAKAKNRPGRPRAGTFAFFV